ncbi:MAG: hypothetical protein ACMUIL_13895 [bacterium]
MMDTAVSIEQLYKEMLKKKGNEERLKMGCTMFKLAGSFMISSLIDKGIRPDRLKKELFLRIYGTDLDEGIKDSIVSKL